MSWQQKNSSLGARKKARARAREKEKDDTGRWKLKKKKKLFPLMGFHDCKLFFTFLDNCLVYFEYGSGGSTHQASIRPNIKKIYSVESDLFWQKTLKKKITNTNITYIFNDMDTKPNTYGNPGGNATIVQKRNYSNQILYLSEKEQDSIDFILIDGRFRVACCLKCYEVINDDCLIAFDDFLNRQYYHIVLKYFDIFKKSSNNCMVILKKKKNQKIPLDLIQKYELIKE